MPLAGRPFLASCSTGCAGHGVDEVILSCGFLADDVSACSATSARHAAPLRRGEEPLGTAGPVRLAEDAARGAPARAERRRAHRHRPDARSSRSTSGPARARTLALIGGGRPSRYGVVPPDEDGAVEAFLEKPRRPVATNRINAGAYVLERDVVEPIPPGAAVSFEREMFPALVGDGLYGFAPTATGSTSARPSATSRRLGHPERSVSTVGDELGDSYLPSRATPRGGRVGPPRCVGRHAPWAATPGRSLAVLRERPRGRRDDGGAGERAQRRGNRRRLPAGPCIVGAGARSATTPTSRGGPCLARASRSGRTTSSTTGRVSSPA